MTSSCSGSIPCQGKEADVSLCLRAGAAVMPSLLQGPGLPWWPHGKGRDQRIVRWSRQVVRQMPQRQVDHVAVVRMLCARCLCQVEPEAMDELHIVLSEMGSVRPEVND